MSRFIKVGNIRDIADDGGAPAPRALPGPVGRGRGRGGVFGGLKLGQRFNQLTTKALDRGQKQAEARLVDLLPDPGSLEGELDEQAAEEALSGLETAVSALQRAKSPAASRARTLLAGVYRAIQSPPQDGWEDEGGGLAGASGAAWDGGADCIGFDEAGAMPTGRHGRGEWR